MPEQRWERDSPDEDAAAARARDRDELDGWARSRRTERLARDAEDDGLLPAEPGRAVLDRRETIDGLAVGDWLAQHPDARDQRYCCAACLCAIDGRRRHWHTTPAGQVVVCGACSHGRELLPGGGPRLDWWLSLPAAQRRAMICAEFGVDPATGERAHWQAVETIADAEGLHESRVARLVQLGRPLLRWDLIKAGRIDLH